MKLRCRALATVLACTAIAGCSLSPAQDEPTATTRVSTQGLSIQTLPKPEGVLLTQFAATPETINETGGLVGAWQVYPYRATMRVADQVAARGAYIVGVDAQGGVHSVIRARTMSNAPGSLEVASLTGDLNEKARLIQMPSGNGGGGVAPAASVVARRVVRDMTAAPQPRDRGDYCPPGRRCQARSDDAMRKAEMTIAAGKIGLAAGQIVASRGVNPKAWLDLGVGIGELVAAEGTIPSVASGVVGMIAHDINRSYNEFLDANGMGVMADLERNLMQNQTWLRPDRSPRKSHFSLNFRRGSMSDGDGTSDPS